MSAPITWNPGLQFVWYDWRLNAPTFRVEALFDNGAWFPETSYATEWWPGAGGFLGDTSTDTSTIGSVQWGIFDPITGAAMRFGFVGVTRNQYGVPVPSVTMMLFRTSNNALVDTTTSDATTGAYLLNTPYYPDAHYIVAHKSGSPDLDGVTVNSLIAT